MTKNKLTKSNIKIFKFFYGFYINGLTCFASQGYILKKLNISESTFKRFTRDFQKEGLYEYKRISSSQTKKSLTEKGAKYVEKHILKSKVKKQKKDKKNETLSTPSLTPHNSPNNPSSKDDMIAPSKSCTSNDDFLVFFSNPDRRVVQVHEETLLEKLQTKGFSIDVILLAIAQLKNFLSHKMQKITNIVNYLTSIVKQVRVEKRYRESNWTPEEMEEKQKQMLNMLYKPSGKHKPLRFYDKLLTFDVKKTGIFFRDNQGKNHFIRKTEFKENFENFRQFIKHKFSFRN